MWEVRINGTVACWGNSERGETKVPAGTFVSVSAGAGFGCAVRTDGTPLLGAAVALHVLWHLLGDVDGWRGLRFERCEWT
jgi:hypothetical protein